MNIENDFELLRKKILNQKVVVEGYLKWFTKLSPDSLKHEALEKRIATLEISEEFLVPLHYEFIDTIAIHLNLVILYTLTNKENKANEMFNLARRSVSDSQNFVDPYKFEKEHIEAAEFLLGSLNKLMKIKFEKDFALENNTVNFTDLHKKSQAFIYAIESRFNGEFIKLKTEEMDLMDKAIESDPTHWSWIFLKSQLLRWNRREIDARSKPSPQEIELVEQVYKFNPSHPKCIFRTLECLSEYMKRKTSRDPTGFPFTFAGIYFSTEREAANFLIDKAEMLRENCPIASWLNQFAKMFSSDFPAHLRNKNFAKSFLERALIINPLSSKINHRMGVFLCQQADYAKGTEYLKSAIELDPNNSPANMDYVGVLMRNHSSNRQLQEFFDHKFVDPTSKDSCIEIDLLFLQGYFYFYYTCEYNKAIESFLKWAKFTEGNEIFRKRKNMLKALSNPPYAYGWKDSSSSKTAKEIFNYIKRYNGPLKRQELEANFQSLNTLLKDAFENQYHSRRKY